MKFTEKGFVKIKMDSKQIGKEEFVIIDVIDTGIGIKQENKEKLFKAFERIEEPGRPTVGTGLGLYLCKKLAVLLKAKIEFESEYRKGSRFSILIPKHQSISK